jgi:hypothetical protein
MISTETLRLRVTAAGWTILLALIGLAAAPANAGCLNDVMKQLGANTSAASGPFIPAVYRPGAADAMLMPVGDFGFGAPIVGVWKFQWSGALTDFGTQAFHSDGTELMFSAGVDPATGDVCQGVWRRVGVFTYKVHHIAMAWLAPGTQYGLLIDIHMTIKLAPSGDSLTGSYDVSVFPASPANPFDESAGPVATGSGSITATRLKAD